MAWAKRKFDTRSATLKYAAKISATLKYWANWKFDTRSATLKYGLSEAKIWHTFGDAQIWQRFPNMTTLTKYVNAYEICQRLRNMSTLTKYVNAYEICQRLWNMSCNILRSILKLMSYFVSVVIFGKRCHIWQAMSYFSVAERVSNFHFAQYFSVAVIFSMRCHIWASPNVCQIFASLRVGFSYRRLT